MSEMDTLVQAPIGKVFVSVEGESSRVGQLTGFVHIADGRYLSPLAALQRLPVQAPVVVLDVSEAAYFDWRPFAQIFFSLLPAGQRGILETRGERPWVATVPIYLNLTPNFTITDMPRALVAGDEVKYIIHSPAEVEEAAAALSPYAIRGLPCFILPRLPIAEARECFKVFLTKPYSEMIRMMLIQHEALEID